MPKSSEKAGCVIKSLHIFNYSVDLPVPVDQSCRQFVCYILTGDASNAIKLFAQQGTLEGTSSDIAEKPDPTIDQAAAAVSASVDSSGSSAPWECIASVQLAHTADVNCVRWHPQEHGLLASAGDDCVVKLWRHHAPTAAASAAGPPAANGSAAG